MHVSPRHSCEPVEVQSRRRRIIGARSNKLGWTLYALVLLPVLVIASPWLLVRHLRALAALRRFAGGARIHDGEARVVDGAILVRTVERITRSDGTLTVRHEDHRFELDAVDRVERAHVVGDGGFADTNTIHYVLRIVPTIADGADGLCIWAADDFTEQSKEALFDPLREAGLLDERPEIPGLLRGCMPHAVVALSFALILGLIVLVRALG